jgi:hypothetical protein
VTEEPARVLRPGHRIALGKDAYTVIQLNGTAVTLQDQHGELSAVMLGYLLTAPGFQALDSAPPRRVPQVGRNQEHPHSRDDQLRPRPSLPVGDVRAGLRLAGHADDLARSVARTTGTGCQRPKERTGMSSEEKAPVVPVPGHLHNVTPRVVVRDGTSTGMHSALKRRPPDRSRYSVRCEAVGPGLARAWASRERRHKSISSVPTTTGNAHGIASAGPWTGPSTVDATTTRAVTTAI